MPRLTDNTAGAETYRIGGSNFTFSATRIGDLGATEYTLVTIAVDVTGSTAGFADELRRALVTAIDACRKSPRSDNLLVRVILFSTAVGGVLELHGFKPLSEIGPNDYAAFDPDGLTPLFDATYSAIGAMAEYGQELFDNDFLANGIAFIITDGWDNRSTATPAMIAREIQNIRQDEKLESLASVLIGINTVQARAALEQFRTEAGLDQFIDIGEVTPGKLAKLAAFVSQSVSSQSQALGTGGKSQNIAATI